MDIDDDKAPAPRDRLLQAFRTLCGQHPKRPARTPRGEPAVLRVIAPLALLVIAAIVVCTGFGLRAGAAGRRLSRGRAPPGFGGSGRGPAGGIPRPCQRRAQAHPRARAGLRPQGTALRDRAWGQRPRGPTHARPQRAHRRLVQLGVGAPGDCDDEPPAAARRSHRVRPCGLCRHSPCGSSAGSACCSPGASSMCRSSNIEDVLTGLPNHNRFFELFDQAVAARQGMETLGLRHPRSRRLRRGERRARLRRRGRGAGRDRQTAAGGAATQRGDRQTWQR